MNYVIKKSRGIEWCIIGLAVFVFLLIWPTNVIHDTYVSKSDEIVIEESGAINVENNATQMFIADDNYLASVDLYIVNEMQGQTVTFRVYDSAYQQLWETFYVVDENAKLPGFVNIPIQLDMEEGWAYYYTIEGLTQDLFVNYEDLYASGSYSNGTLTHGGMEVLERNIIIRYNYTSPFPWWMVLISGVVLAGIAFGGITFIRKKLVGTKRDTEVVTQKIIQCIANPIIAVVTAYTLFTIFPGRKFGTGMVNYGCYYLGTLLLAAVLLYVVNFKRSGNAPLVDFAVFKTKIPHILQAICFAGCLWSCFEYMNGLYDIHHEYATCKLMTWLGLAIIVTYGKKELLNWYNLVYVIVAPIAAYFYAKPYVGVVEQDVLYELRAYFFVVAGFILLNMIRVIVLLIVGKIKKNQTIDYAKINIPYLIAVVVMVGLLIIFRNTRDWPILIAAMFGVFYFRIWVWKDREYLLENFCNGIIFNFIYAVIYCMMHRPYHRYYFYRYGMMFHTVTMTGAYLTLILAAIIARWIIVYKKTGCIKETWKELCLLGTASIYLLLTLSRTGFIGTFAIIIVGLIIGAIYYSNGKNKFAYFGKQLATWIIVTVVFFPIVFTATRIIPTYTDDPIRSEVEESWINVTKGYPADGEFYMDFPRFIEVAAEKLFGIDVDQLGQSEEVAIANMDILVASTGDTNIETTSDGTVIEEVSDVSNGRIEIFIRYLNNMNMTGHDKMSLQEDDGFDSVHAHNTFIQVMYDHGIPAGIAFILFGVGSLVLGIVLFVRKKENNGYALLITTVLVGFAVCGLVEWIFHPCNPFGFAIFIVITPLLFMEKGKKEDETI